MKKEYYMKIKANFSFNHTHSTQKNTMKKERIEIFQELLIIWETCWFVKILKTLIYLKMQTSKKETNTWQKQDN